MCKVWRVRWNHPCYKNGGYKSMGPKMASILPMWRFVENASIHLNEVGFFMEDLLKRCEVNSLLQGPYY
ncbi:hypothetical protein Zmor_021618 [Zophobas morio]|uniref:Uncharacterized protein n=1 Tax=Zophobas morio TaxID=2755281 RepID=A0AA38I8G5_9CUCU|nr:hypothetical protein Zmor_021618 [Zophobas morio]